MTSVPYRRKKLSACSAEKPPQKDRFYGTTTVGARGQVVIPVEARKDLRLKPGDQLVVMGKFGKALGLMKTDQLAEFVEMVMAHVAGSGKEAEVEQQLRHMLSSIKT